MCAAIDSSPFPFSSLNRRRCALSVNCQKSTCRRSTSGLSPDPDSHLESELDAECYVDHRQVKGLLKDKKLERLVDGNLEGNYTEEEVEQVIQVALLCTHNSPMQRPTTREAVRMLQAMVWPREGGNNC